jgi:hypothetical protein
MKSIPQANQTYGFEISTGQTKKFTGRGPSRILNTAYITSIGALSTLLLAAKFPG